MELETFLSHLKKVKGNGGQYTALCPAHTTIRMQASVFHPVRMAGYWSSAKPDAEQRILLPQWVLP